MPRVKPQISMDDKFIEDPELEKLLEERQGAKGAASVANKEYRGLDEQAQARVMALDLTETVRCGRFLLSKKTISPKEVSFETAESTRARIQLAEAEE